MGIIFLFLLKIFTIFRLLLGGFVALPTSPKYIQSTLFEILASDSMHQIYMLLFLLYYQEMVEINKKKLVLWLILRGFQLHPLPP